MENWDNKLCPPLRVAARNLGGKEQVSHFISEILSPLNACGCSWSPSVDRRRGPGLCEILCRHLQCWLDVAFYSLWDLNYSPWNLGWLTFLSDVLSSSVMWRSTGQPLGLACLTATFWPLYATGPSPLEAVAVAFTDSEKYAWEFYGRWSASLLTFTNKDTGAHVKWFTHRHTSRKVAELGI